MIPVLDNILKEISSQLESKLPWLDVSFGKAERISKKIGSNLCHIPAIYRGREGFIKNEYLSLFPDSKIGNFSFFWFPDPQRINWEDRSQSIINAPFSLIFWFDLRKVFETEINRNKEGLKAQILNVLSRELFLSEGHIQIDKSYELAENIYRDFTISEVDNQFLMHPYAGFRFDGTLTYTQPCL